MAIASRKTPDVLISHPILLTALIASATLLPQASEAAPDSPPGPEPTLPRGAGMVAVRQKVGGLAQQLLSAADHAKTSPRVAVLYLGNADGKRSKLTDYITSVLINEMGRSAGGLRLVERTTLDKVLNELSLAQSGVLMDDPVGRGATVGRLLGADMLVLGNVTVLRQAIDINLRLVESSSGHILFTADAQVGRSDLGQHVAGEPVSSAPALSLSSLFLGERQIKGRLDKILLRDGTVLSSGDGIKIVFETSRRAYVYVLLLDSRGQASVVFPNTDIAVAHRVPGGTSVEVPPGKQWFFLDDKRGQETLYVVASLRPLTKVKRLLKTLEHIAANGRGKQAIDKAVAAFGGGDNKPVSISRGIGGIRPGRARPISGSKGDVSQQSQEILRGEGSVVRAVTFVHD